MTYIRFVISRIRECVSRIAYRAQLADKSATVRTAIYQSIQRFSTAWKQKNLVSEADRSWLAHRYPSWSNKFTVRRDKNFGASISQCSARSQPNRADFENSLLPVGSRLVELNSRLDISRWRAVATIIASESAENKSGRSTKHSNVLNDT